MRLFYWHKLLNAVACVFFAAGVVGCAYSDSETEVLKMNPEVPIVFEVEFSNGSTRAVTDNLMTTFAFYAYQGKTVKASNVLYTKQSDGSWTGELVTMSNSDMNIFGLSPNYAGAQNMKMNYKNHYFDYVLPNGNYPDFSYASMIATNYTKSGGTVKMSFISAFTYLSFACRANPTKMPTSDYTVIVKSIKLHNITSRGKFAFLETGNNKVTWTPYTEDEDYITYEQVFSTPVTLTNAYESLTDSAIVCIPQTITKWGTKATAPVTTAYADANHHCYVELECQVIDSEGNYKWGSEDGTGTYPMYESVYIPFTSTKAYGINDRSTLRINFDGGFDRDGVPTVFHTEKSTHLDIEVEDWIVEEGTEQGGSFEVEF